MCHGNSVPKGVTQDTMFRQVDCVRAVRVVPVKVKQSEMIFCSRNFVHIPGWSAKGPVNLGSGSSVLEALTVFRSNYRSSYRCNKQWSCDSSCNDQRSMVHNFHPTRIAVTELYAIPNWNLSRHICLIKHDSYFPVSKCTPTLCFMDIHLTKFILTGVEK